MWLVLYLLFMFIGHPQGMPLPCPGFGYNLLRIGQQHHGIRVYNNKVRLRGLRENQDSYNPCRWVLNAIAAISNRQANIKLMPTSIAVPLQTA